VKIPHKEAAGSGEQLRVLMLGDVVGRPGRKCIERSVRVIRERMAIDLVVANGENAAGGAGIDAGTAFDLQKAGVDIVTLGDHAFQRKGAPEFLDKNSSWCVRPLNLPQATTPGKGWTTWQRADGVSVVVANLMGRVFMNGSTGCPFAAIDSFLLEVRATGDSIAICDFHAEATSEKWAMGRFTDGRLSLLVGTHTHVQTADAQTLPGGTGYITDLGMSGSNSGVIGMAAHVALKRFTSPLPAPYEIAEGEGVLHGIVADICVASKKTVWIKELRADAHHIVVGGKHIVEGQ
jgi:metallophosphoesterase (TIGR00282 family)